MNNIFKTIFLFSIAYFSIFSLSSCAKNNTYDSLQSMVEARTIIGNYYTQEFENHETISFKLNNYAPRQQPKYLNLNFLPDGSILIDNIDLNFNNEDKIDGRFIVQNGSWEKLKNGNYKLIFKGIYFAEGNFYTEGEYEFRENSDKESELIRVKSFKSIKENNGVFN